MCNPLKPKPYKIIEILKDTEHEWRFRVAFTEPVKPGQFFQVSLPRIGEMPISVSGMQSDGLEMTIRKVGKVTSEVFNLIPDSTIYMRGPYGTSFDFEEFKDKNVVIVAGGSGTAPVKPLIEYFYDNPDYVKSLDIIFGFRSPEFILFKDDIDKWAEKFNMILTIDKPVENWDGLTGLTTKYISELQIENIDNVRAAIVGPPIMIGFCAKALKGLGVENKQITVSMERRMACGIGKCGRCKIGDIYICQDGPIMNYEKAIKLID